MIPIDDLSYAKSYIHILISLYGFIVLPARNIRNTKVLADV